MKPFKKYLALASLSTIVSYSQLNPPLSTTAVGPAPSQAKASSRVATAVEPNRRPAIEPRVYLESSASESGFVYYDYDDQPDWAARARQQHEP